MTLVQSSHVQCLHVDTMGRLCTQSNKCFDVVISHLEGRGEEDAVTD